jgi:hypothetical protein
VSAQAFYTIQPGRNRLASARSVLVELAWPNIGHEDNCLAVDQPIGALLADLKGRGLLDTREGVSWPVSGAGDEASTQERPGGPRQGAPCPVHTHQLSPWRAEWPGLGARASVRHYADFPF